jgi:tRNA(fMet)-specific endonuclease VapC
MRGKMFLVETSTVSLHQREDPRVSERIAATDLELLFTSIVTVEEQFRGRLAVIAGSHNNPRRLVRGYNELEQTRLYFLPWQVLPFTEEEYQTTLRLRRDGVRIGTLDLRIAATALRRGFIVVTHNVADFARVPGLVVEDWSA